MNKKIIGFLIVILLVAGGYKLSLMKQKNNPLKLYWFIPDGVRAEPYLFNVFQWAKEGKLPNIKKLMDRGSYGYSYPNFPSHTPTNFATLLTGAYPVVNGVNDGPMHEVGKPLDKVAVGGFRSVAKKVPPIWKTLEEAGLKVALLSIPGSTPPDTKSSIVIRGRWGGWGADFNAINFESKGDLSQRVIQGRGVKLFFFGAELSKYVDPQQPKDWTLALPKSYSEPYEIELLGWGTPVFAYVYDSSNDNTANYDKALFSLDKKSIIADLSPGQWSGWNPITLSWKVEERVTPVATDFKINLIKLAEDKFFRVRLEYDNLNEYITQPSEAAMVLKKNIGPMVDFADNYPPQLVYYPEDKKTFDEELAMSFDWHTKAVSVMSDKFSPNVIIHDIYTPNQMLTSRWWMGYVDPKSKRYDSLPAKERERLWNEVKDMYVRLDTMVGEILKSAGSDTYIVFSSDHGNIPLDRSVNLNNLFAQKGWLSFTINPKTGEPIIDWQNTKVIYLKMAHVYINPNGLAGNYERTSGPEYEKLRNEVIAALVDLKDENGIKPVVDIVKWENAKDYMQLDPKRIGDLVIANAPGYGWYEEMSSDLKVFSEPLITGYKQAIKSKDVPGMWTPFIIAGPGIKENNFLGNTPFELVNQYPTIMKAIKVPLPSFVQGKPLPVFR